jgi:hypothetical protein
VLRLFCVFAIRIMVMIRLSVYLFSFSLSFILLIVVPNPSRRIQCLVFPLKAKLAEKLIQSSGPLPVKEALDFFSLFPPFQLFLSFFCCLDLFWKCARLLDLTSKKLHLSISFVYFAIVFFFISKIKCNIKLFYIKKNR